MFEWTINLGHILTVAGLVIVYYISTKVDFHTIKNKLVQIEDQQKILNEAFRQLGSILTQVAVQDNRLSMMEKNLDELRHGKGIIKE